MGKKVEVSYNPQLGYLQTIFHHNFDFLTGIKSYTERTDGVEFVVDTYKENTVKVFIQCVGETAFRFRMYTPGNEHPFDNSIYQLEGQNGVNITENEEFISISKGKIEARVRKYPWEVSYYLDGKLKTKEQIKDSNVDNMCKNLPVGFTYDENKEIIGVNETMYLYADEEFYGFGEKFTDFGKRGQTINCWQTDALSTNTEKSYKNHPFFMSSRGYAILLNTYTRSKFEMGSFSNVAYNMSVEDKVLDYVIWMGNDYKALLKSYINQTGKIPMIPKWALGLWMSKCSYQTQDEIYEVVKISKERDIKIDVIHIDGWQKEGDAGAWVWDYERFPNPEEMIYKLKKEGIHLCLWIFPYIDENSKYFKEAEEKGFLVKNTKGVTSRFYSTATSTSKVGCFDFTNPHFIEWYKPKVRSVVSMGIGAVKTDFSEAVPEDAVYFDGSTGIQGHNKLTFLYAKTIYDIMAEVKIPLGELPMLWGRSGYAGSHTIPAAWAGDSSTHLNNHACILRGGLSASMSGIPFWGFDMGGFYNTDHEGYECVPTDEEYIRSCQFGFFNSLSRCHGKTPREPWNFGEKAEKIFKKFNDIRHLLLPYLYSTTYKTHLSDIPVIRPVVMEYPEDRSARNVELEYFLGDSLLVVPVFDQEDEIDVYLPNGQWIDLFTHERIKGGRWVKRKIELDKIPVFIRQNKMIPMLTKIPENIEEKYENLDVILFCEDEIRDTYIDDGNVQNLKATNFDIVISDEGSMGRSFVFYPGNAECMTEEELNIEYISNSSYFYMANLDSVTKKAAQMAKQKGSKIFMDADSYTDELLDAISWIDIFIGSEFVYEKMLEAGKSVKENCEYLYNKGPEIVIFTFGEKGCAGISKEGFFEIPAFDVDVKDTVGAGDVFHGAFLAAIVKGLSPKDAARFASGVAAIKCTRIGGRAGIPNWEVTDNFLETGEIDYREIDERVKKYGRGIEYV